MSTTEASITIADEVEAVFREDGDRLWRSLCGLALDRDLASDAVAEAFAQALRRGRAIRDVRAWVWRAAYRIADGELRRRRTTAVGPVPARAVLDGADVELLDALRGLTSQQRAVLTLFYYADCPVREISRRTGMNQLAVRAHLSRGRKRLRRILGDDDA